MRGPSDCVSGTCRWALENRVVMDRIRTAGYQTGASTRWTAYQPVH